MKANRNQRFDLDVLRDLAGPKAFTRGQAYHREGRVAILSFERQRVIARVAGTEDYRTEVTGRGEEIDGNCSCPASPWRYLEFANFCLSQGRRMAALRSVSEQTVYVAALKDRFHRRRNFMKLLK